MTIQSLIMGATLLACNFTYAEEVKALPITAQDIADHMGIHSFKWSYEAQKPFDKIKIELSRFERDENGVFKKVVLNSSESSFSEIKDAGTYPIAVLFGKDKYSLNGLNIKSVNHDWKVEDGVCAYSEKPLYLDGEYIFMATWNNKTITDRKQDMLSYVCMTIEATKK